MPFGRAWTDDLRLEDFAAFHRAALAEWTPESWDCNFVTFLDGEPIGTQGLHGHDFGATRTVGSGSWLGAAFQGQGYGTEQRAAVLELAFRGLGAVAAETGAVAANRRSQRVTEKLGYRFAFENTVSPRPGESVPHLNYRLEREDWRSPFPVALEGLDACRHLFGAV